GGRREPERGQRREAAAAGVDGSSSLSADPELRHVGIVEADRRGELALRHFRRQRLEGRQRTARQELPGAARPDRLERALEDLAGGTGERDLDRLPGLYVLQDFLVVVGEQVPVGVADQ